MGVNILKQVQNDGGEFFKNTVVLNLQFLLIYCLVFYEKLFLNIFLPAKKIFSGFSKFERRINFIWIYKIVLLLILRPMFRNQ